MKNDLSQRIVELSPTKRALLKQRFQEPRGFTEPIAIVGLSCRFPGGSNAEAFWQVLHNGVDAITEVPRARWNVDAYYDPRPATPGKMYTRWGGFLEQIDQFDPAFFGISPKEGARLDPQQRLLLEVAWEAIESAGIPAGKLAGTETGVFVGISCSDYSVLQLTKGVSTNPYSITGIAYSIAANRLSYFFDLRGPSLAVDTACSSSLVSVHLACQSLRVGESDLALAGGVNLLLSPEPTITFSQARMMSSDGHCKSFDATADGYVRGEGCGMIVLKRLTDACSDGDRILALIRGSAVNQDGRSNGLTAPNGPAQVAVIRRALEKARVAPSELSYIEAHGTGTPLGDPIEVQALTQVLKQGRAPNQPCLLGSVKTNIGHLEAAAGIAGLIKVVLSLINEEIPPHLNFKRINPHIILEQSPLVIAEGKHQWTAGGRFAGVSSFGFGGTNAHVILEEAPFIPRAACETERPLHLLSLSAKSERALKELARRYADHLATHPAIELADLCFTANVGREHLSHRLALVAESGSQLSESLSNFVGQEKHEPITGRAATRRASQIAFLFPGQGAQQAGIGRQLYETQPTFRRLLDECAELLRPALEQPLLDVLFFKPELAHFLNQTLYTQTSLFCLEYSLAQLWRSWGIEPTFVMGHSLGEYVAACVGGVFSLEGAFKLVTARGRLMQQLSQDGLMAVAFADESRVSKAIAADDPGRVSIAALNGPENVVLSGARKGVCRVLSRLQADGVRTQELNTSHAFHSPLMEPILDDFEDVVRALELSMPQLEMVSNVTGDWVGEEITRPSYWRRHVREPVRFAAGIQRLYECGCRFLIELGPTPTLMPMAKRLLPDGEVIGLTCFRKGRSEWQQQLDVLAKLYLHGCEVDWRGFDQDYPRRKVSLPTYPFERTRLWFEFPKTHPLLGRRV